MKNREKKLEELLGISFKNQNLLHTALIHRSYLNESPETNSNERLEFLGDAVLEFIVSSGLYDKYKAMQEGDLTALRSRLVNTASLAKIAEKLELGQALYMSKGEEVSGGRKNQSLLADTFEAVIGAIFLDQGIEAAKAVVEKFALPYAEQEKKNLKDPKSLLQEITQQDGKPAPSYKVLEQRGPDHARVFTVGVFVGERQIAVGSGKNKQTAEQKAAHAALQILNKSQI